MSDHFAPEMEPVEERPFRQRQNWVWMLRFSAGDMASPPLSQRGRSSLHPHHCNLGETLFESGSLELGCHALHQIFLYRAFAATVAVQAYFKWHIKKYRMNLIAKALSHLDPLPALVRPQVGCVHIIPGHAGDQASPEQ